MGAVNNFEQIKGLLNFSSPFDFYYVAILKRKSDDPTATKSVKVVDNYAIYSLEDLEKKKDTIIQDCDLHNARAYIYVNKRNSNDVALKTMSLITEYLINKDYKAVRGAYWKAVGRGHSENNKRWIVDIDTKDDVEIGRIILEVGTIQAEAGGGAIFCTIPTKSGVHLLTTPFNLSLFRERYPDIDVHKDNPTLLYFNGLS